MAQELIDAGLFTTDHARALIIELIKDPVVGPWHHNSPTLGAQWLQNAENLRNLERIVEIGFEMHEHPRVDFDGWAYRPKFQHL